MDFPRFQEALDYTQKDRVEFLKLKKLKDRQLEIQTFFENNQDKIKILEQGNIQSLFDYKTKLQSELLLNQSQYEKLLLRLEEVKTQVTHSGYFYNFWKEVLAKTNNRYLTELSNLLTQCYQTIYQDDKKRIHLISEEYRNKQVIKIRIEAIVNGVSYPEEFKTQAGSIKSIIGLITAMYFIVLTGAPRILFIDETLASLDWEILSRTLQLLHKFKDDMGFCYLCITHHGKYIQNYVDKAYTIVNGHYEEIDPSEVV